jgi:uncharacterized protein (TIRG00374 family)
MAKKVKKDFKFWLNIITIVALLGLIIITRNQVIDAFEKLRQLNGIALLLMIPLQILNYYAVARLYKDYFKSQGEDKLTSKTMFAIALELNFVNHVFPSGGVSGFSYLNLRLKQSGISSAKSALAQLLRFGLTFVSFLVLLFIGMFVLAFRRHTSPLTILIGSSLAFLTLIGLILSIFIISDVKRIQAFTSFLPKVLNKIASMFRRKKDIIDISKIDHTMRDLHLDYITLSKDWKQLLRPFWWAMVVNVTDIATIYAVYIAFGSFINPGALILSYGVANFAGLVAVLPGGVGVYEGLMTATLSSAGVDKALALSATVVYRVLNMLFFLPPGYFLYRRVLKRSGGIIKAETDNHVVPPTFPE